MPTSDALKDILASNVTHIIPIWKMVAQDSTVAAYAAHTRVLIFEGTTYNVAPIEISTTSQSIGLKSNTSQLTGTFDNIITRADVEAGKWQGATITLQYVNYLDLTMGSTGKQVGRAGKFDLIGETFKVELRSLASLLGQTIGELTSPTDRNSFPSGVDPADFTVNRTVTAVVDRRTFSVSGSFDEQYYRYGLVTWSTGNNAGLSMEVQESTGAQILLQLPMPDDIQIGDTVDCLAGYDGSRNQNRDRFDDVINFNAESDLPGLKKALQFPE